MSGVSEPSVIIPLLEGCSRLSFQLNGGFFELESNLETELDGPELIGPRVDVTQGASENGQNDTLIVTNDDPNPRGVAVWKRWVKVDGMDVDLNETNTRK